MKERKPSPIRVAKKWKKLPPGWTDKSVEKFWGTLTGTTPQHKVWDCVSKMEKVFGGGAGAFCGGLADWQMPGWRQKNKKESPEARTDARRYWKKKIKKNKGKKAVVQWEQEIESDEEANPLMTQPDYGTSDAALPRGKEAAPARYEHIDFTPPKVVAEAAKKGLELRQKASPSNRGGLTPAEASKEGIGSGVQRAVNLKNRDSVSPKVIKQMRGFLSRAEKASRISPDNKSTPWNDKGYVAWLLWGGDPAKAWVNKIIGQMEAADKKGKQAALSLRWGSMLTQAAENEPTNPKLWAKVQALAKGEQKSMAHGGKTINGPNDGKGFKVFPSAYANGWASKIYGDLGGGWKKKARGKAKKDVGHGGLDEWFSGHGGSEGKGEDATWGDWVSISPVTKKLDSGKKVEKGDIVGPCGVSNDPDWKETTKNGEDPLKCMPRQKAYDTPKKDRADVAKAKQKAEKADSNKGKKPTMTPTFPKKAKIINTIWVVEDPTEQTEIIDVLWGTSDMQQFKRIMAGGVQRNRNMTLHDDERSAVADATKRLNRLWKGEIPEWVFASAKQGFRLGPRHQHAHSEVGQGHRYVPPRL